ncbi:paired amphipathic helix protein Sin3-like 3 isoform X2 [Vicia villosa]|uniref:paired amphipathic helix protein Sin3-like 3 isoform X2 n=1 Tax=Vicia villosa TaxID=3911 RepID=UPI00273C88E3|nr:paired amphipathic helix protein Sin3-like 3 isoform X2 [Vicia villosa]
MSKGSSSKEEVTCDDAKIYLQEIKVAFKDEKQKFNEFLKTMKDIKKKRAEIASMLARVKEMFEGHGELLLKFNTYLSDEFEIAPSPEKPEVKKPEVNIEYARKYLDNVKTRFQGDPNVYKSFLTILNMYRNKEKSREEVLQMVISLFKDQSDLVEGFIDFLP